MDHVCLLNAAPCPMSRSEVVANNGAKIAARQGSKLKSTLIKVWSMEEIQSEVEAAVRKVISIESSQQIDHDISLMDEGSDCLGTTVLSASLQSQVGIELPPTLVFINPTIADMSNHLFGILVQESHSGHSECLKEARDRNNSSKTHTIDLIQFEVEAAVRKVISIESSQ